jgi:hypothetical protein
MNEGKRGYKEIKHVASPKKPIKKRNPVAHAAQSVAKGSGAHKDKKKADKQGDMKHKKSEFSMLEGTQYDQKLNLMFKMAVLEDKISETAPKGWEGTVKAMKKHKEIDNPYALTNWMKNKGYKSHKKSKNVEEGLNEHGDHEGEMARGQLIGAAKQAMELARLMGNDAQLDAWVQTKISLAADYIDTVHQFLLNNQQDVNK